MITLGTARLHADDRAYDVSVAITWEREHAWSGILGGQIPWSELLHHSLELEVPASLAPDVGDQPAITDVVIDAVLEDQNEVQARGVITTRGAHPRHLSWHAPA